MVHTVQSMCLPLHLALPPAHAPTAHVHYVLNEPQILTNWSSIISMTCSIFIFDDLTAYQNVINCCCWLLFCWKMWLIRHHPFNSSRRKMESQTTGERRNFKKCRAVSPANHQNRIIDTSFENISYFWAVEWRTKKWMQQIVRHHRYVVSFSASDFERQRWIHFLHRTICEIQQENNCKMKQKSYFFFFSWKGHQFCLNRCEFSSRLVVCVCVVWHTRTIWWCRWVIVIVVAMVDIQTQPISPSSNWLNWILGFAPSATPFRFHSSNNWI